MQVYSLSQGGKEVAHLKPLHIKLILVPILRADGTEKLDAVFAVVVRVLISKLVLGSAPLFNFFFWASSLNRFMKELGLLWFHVLHKQTNVSLPR